MNLKKISLSLFILILFTFLQFCACSSSSLSGGSEVGNPVIASGLYGKLVDESDNSLSNAKVSLLPVHYNPSKINNTLEIDTFTTDSNGFYIFENIDSASYNVLAFFQDTSLAIFIGDVLYKDSVLNVGVNTMRSPGAVLGSITINVPEKSGIICYIPGTTFYSTTDDSGKFILPNVPEGNYTINYEYYRFPGDTDFITLTDTNVIISSGLDTKTPVVHFQVPDVNSIIFESGFEGGPGVDWDNSDNSTTPWKGTPVSAVSSDNSREGNKSVHFFPGDITSSHTKLQIRDGSLSSIDWNSEYWIGFSINIIKQPLAPSYCLINQHASVPHLLPDGSHDWNTGAGPNSFAIEVKEAGKFGIRTSTMSELVDSVPTQGSALWGTNVVYVPFELNKWYDFVLHFRYATDGTGFIEVWVDGIKVVEYLNQPTVYKYDLSGEPRDSYQFQKIGINYGLGNSSSAGEILYDAYRMGNEKSNYEEVAPKP